LNFCCTRMNRESFCPPPSPILITKCPPTVQKIRFAAPVTGEKSAVMRLSKASYQTLLCVTTECTEERTYKHFFNPSSDGPRSWGSKKSGFFLRTYWHENMADEGNKILWTSKCVCILDQAEVLN
jgi:hypothetical protein